MAEVARPTKQESTGAFILNTAPLLFDDDRTAATEDWAACVEVAANSAGDVSVVVVVNTDDDVSAWNSEADP